LLLPIAVALSHLPLWLLSTIAAALSVALPSTIAIAVALAVGHCRHHHRRPSQLPSPLGITVAIAVDHFQEFCLGAARIVFNQLKQS
jgi:hypothetical protein